MKSVISPAVAILLAMTALPGFGQAPDAPPAVFREGVRVLFQGDSITDGGRERNGRYPDHQLGHGYAYIIAARYGGYFPELKLSFFNRGVSGNKLSDMIGRWGPDTIAMKPDVLSILIGVNDVWHNVEGGRQINFAEIEAAYDKVLTETKVALPDLRIVLCEPFILPGQVNTKKWQEWDAATKQIQQIVARLGAKHKLPVVHFQKMFDAATKRAPAEYWLFDGVHPYYAGNQLMADEWIRTVKQAWPK